MRRTCSRMMTVCATRAAVRAVAAPIAASPAAFAPAFCLMSVRRYADATADGGTRQGQYLLDKGDVLQRILEVVKNFEKVDASKVTAESHFINDLGLDSLDVVEVVMALEQEFILDIPDHDAEKIQSIGEAVEYIASNPQSK